MSYARGSSTPRSMRAAASRTAWRGSVRRCRWAAREPPRRSRPRSCGCSATNRAIARARSSTWPAGADRASGYGAVMERVRWLGVVAAGLVVGACGGGNKAAPTATPRAAKTVKPPRRQAQRSVLEGAPVHTRGAASRRVAIPILTYHVVAAAPAGAPYPQLWVNQETFAGEMAALHRAGYHAITLEAAYRAWTAGGPLPRKPVVLSFDDGYASDSTHARPVLQRYGWPGVLNLVLHNLGPKGITQRQVRGLIAAGWEIDSHTLTHPALTTLPAGQLRRELV